MSSEPEPRRFVIPRDELPEGFVAPRGTPAGEPVPARAAATVVLAREGAAGPEVLLLRRPEGSRFAGGAWVFPGGVVDAADRGLDAALLGPGPTPGEWARRLGVEDEAEAVAYVVAALREAWEETGILLADGLEGTPPGRLREARSALLADRLSLPGFLDAEGGRLATGGLLYIAHWITPLSEPRRYDTRFFLARVGAGAECELCGPELTAARWLTPPAALAASRAGHLRLLPPTAHTLERLDGHASLDALARALRDVPVPTFLPRVRVVPEGVVVELGGES